jgi:hypothetical protein
MGERPSLRPTRMTQLGHWRPKFAVMHNAASLQRCGRVRSSG